MNGSFPSDRPLDCAARHLRRHAPSSRSAMVALLRLVHGPRDPQAAAGAAWCASSMATVGAIDRSPTPRLEVSEQQERDQTRDARVGVRGQHQLLEFL